MTVTASCVTGRQHILTRHVITTKLTHLEHAAVAQLLGHARAREALRRVRVVRLEAAHVVRPRRGELATTQRACDGGAQ